MKMQPLILIVLFLLIQSTSGTPSRVDQIRGREILHTRVAYLDSFKSTGIISINDSDLYRYYFEIDYQIWNPKLTSVQLNFPDEDLCTFQLETNLSILSKIFGFDCLHHPSWSDILLTPGLNNFSLRTTLNYEINENQTAVEGIYSFKIGVVQGQGDLNIKTSYPGYLIVANNQSSTLIQPSLLSNWGREIKELDNLTHFHEIRIARVQFVLAPEYPRSVFQINGTLEEWNPSAESVNITHPAACDNKLVLHAVFESQNLFTLLGGTCLNVVTTYKFAPGLKSIDFRLTFSVYNQFETSIPDGRYTLSYSYDQVETNIHTATIDVVHGTWTVLYARIPILWSEDTIYPPALQKNTESETAQAIVKSDTDLDGIPDWFEDNYGLDLHNPEDAQLDPDGDGLTNLEEYQQGSNPLVNNYASANEDTALLLIPTDLIFPDSFILTLSGGLIASTVVLSSVKLIHVLLNRRSSVYWKKNLQFRNPEPATKKEMYQAPHNAVLQKIDKLRLDFETQNDV